MGRELQKSQNTKRSVVIGRHKTSVSLEYPFWKSLHDIAVIRNVPLSDLLATIDAGRQYGGLSSAIRLFVLEHYRVLAERRAGPTTAPATEQAHAGDAPRPTGNQ